MAIPVNPENNPREALIPAEFPFISISSVNCNSLNMSTVTKHTRIRKFYGIASLKTDVIFLSDLRMCNKAGVTDLKFISDTFAINPHCSYNFVHHSRANSRGVGILYKKSLNFTISETEKDPASDNFILVRANVSGQTVILGSVYGPNNRNDDFFVLLCEAIHRLGEHPTVIGGDWNATPSCLPVTDNPDVLNMQEVPNAVHSRKIRELCERFNMAESGPVSCAFSGKN